MSSADERKADRALAALRRHEQEQPAAPSRYERLEELGRGGAGTVHKARDRELGRLVALKLLDPAAASQREALARFRREAESLARLSHPHIVGFLDLLESPPAIVLELVPGRTLAEHLEAGTLDRGARLALVEKVARALEHAHGLGIVHRDLKPSNILVTDALEPKVADFGIAHLAAHTGPALTSTQAFLGTPVYMAPEQAVGSARLADARTDVHALGVILYELLTGRLPYAGETPTELLARIAAAPPRAPRQLDPTIPPALEALVLRALEKAPERRFQTAGELADALRAAAAVKPPRPRPLLPLLLVAAAATTSAALALRGPRSDDAPPDRAGPGAPADARGPEARLRAGEVAPGELEAIAAVGSGAELLERLARDAVVLPLEGLQRARDRADPRCRAPLAALEAVALLVGGETPERARARLKGGECRGLALTLFDVAAGVARVREQLSEPGLHLVVGRRGRVEPGALDVLSRLSGRADLLVAAVAPLASECRADLVAHMTLGTPAVEAALARASCLEPVLERLPPGLSAAYVQSAQRWELASRLARTIEARDPLLAGHCALLAFLHRTPAGAPPDDDEDRRFAEATLRRFVQASSAAPDEVAFAQRCLYLVSREAARRALVVARDRPQAERGLALESALVACRAALALSGCALGPRESAQDAHRVAGVAVLLGDPEGARRTPGLHAEDLLTDALPADLRALEVRATRLVDRPDPSYVALGLALAVRSRARSLLGDAAGADGDDQRLASLQSEDAWLDRAVAERLVRAP